MIRIATKNISYHITGSCVSFFLFLISAVLFFFKIFDYFMIILMVAFLGGTFFQMYSFAKYPKVAILYDSQNNEILIHSSARSNFSELPLRNKRGEFFCVSTRDILAIQSIGRLSMDGGIFGVLFFLFQSPIHNQVMLTVKSDCGVQKVEIYNVMNAEHAESNLRHYCMERQGIKK